MIAAGTVAKVVAPIVAAAAFGAAVVVTYGGSASAVGDARSWIDDPLSTTALTAGRIEVVAHATDPEGVDTVRLLVDGHQVATRSGRGRRLARARFRWDATAGTHVLTVAAEGTQGTEGMPAQVVVGVDHPGPEEPGPATTSPTVSTAEVTTAAPTSTPGTTIPATTTSAGPSTTGAPTPSTAKPATSTTLPPPTTPPTTGACTPGIPNAVAPRDGARLALGPILSWDPSGSCPADAFVVQVSLDAATFARPAEATVFVTQWGPAPLAGCGPYWWRVAAISRAGSTRSEWSTPRAYTLDARGC